jgi:hypothetical protein
LHHFFLFLFHICFQTDSIFIATDNKIIIDLGIECPSTDENVKAAWHEGLKVFSEQLRAEKVRDPEVIASKLVQFRRAFIGDPSRILNLGDIQI